MLELVCNRLSRFSMSVDTSNMVLIGWADFRSAGMAGHLQRSETASDATDETGKQRPL